MVNNWRHLALCKHDPKSYSWLSYKIEEVRYAKNLCNSCPVFNECLYNSIFLEKEFYGVNAGMSEYDFMVLTWVEVDNGRKRNWKRDNRSLYKTLQRKE